MAEIISTAVALIAAFVLGYGLRGEREKTHCRTLTTRTAVLEAANARLRDHLRLSAALNEELLKKQLADDLAARVAAGPVPGFEQSVRALYVYGAMAWQPSPIRPIIGGGGV